MHLAFFFCNLVSIVFNLDHKEIFIVTEIYSTEHKKTTQYTNNPTGPRNLRYDPRQEQSRKG